jgi:hypothetical protein
MSAEASQLTLEIDRECMMQIAAGLTTAPVPGTASLLSAANVRRSCIARPHPSGLLAFILEGPRMLGVQPRLRRLKHQAIGCRAAASPNG